MSDTKFAKKVYKICKKIPLGYISTYKEIAKQIGKPKAYRAVGTALSINPYAPIVPCHRVVKSDGSLGGFFGSVGKKLLKKKQKLLEKEGIKFTNEKIKDFEKKLFKF